MVTLLTRASVKLVTPNFKVLVLLVYRMMELEKENILSVINSYFFILICSFHLFC